EIGELSLGLQVKLLRALQERRIKAVGATDELEMAVRGVAATNRGLEEEAAGGPFRADLSYPLNFFELRLPPLRQRREDIPLLAEHFMRSFATEQAKEMTGIAPAAMKRLEEYDFPGNVRELENVVERAVALSSESVIDADVLPSFRASARAPADPALDFPPDGVDLDRLVHDYERAIVTKALERAGGVRKKAAALLGITFRSLRYRLEKLGFDKGDDGSEDD